MEALKAIAPLVAPDDVVCLMDTDLFLYGDLQAEVFPAGNAMAANNIVADRLSWAVEVKHGIDLQSFSDPWAGQGAQAWGAVTVFMTGATISNEKIIQDCFRFAQIIYLLGKTAALPDKSLWMSEMACFAMALTANGIDYELLDVPQFALPEPQQATVAEGSFFHYYCDINDDHGGRFFGSEWHKQLFRTRDFLAENLDSFSRSAQSEVERRFLDLAMAARRRPLESGAR